MSSRTAHGHQFEVEISQGFQLALEYLGDTGYDFPLLNWFKITDTSTLRYQHCTSCGMAQKFCSRCSAQLVRTNFAPKSEADFRVYLLRKMLLVEAKSTKNETSFPWRIEKDGKEGNIRPLQWRTCLLTEQVDYIDYWWALNDRRRKCNSWCFRKKEQCWEHYRMWMVKGHAGIKLLRRTSKQVKGQGRHGDSIKWPAFLKVAELAPEQIIPCPRVIGGYWDLTPWLSIVAGQEFPAPSGKWIKTHMKFGKLGLALEEQAG